jgi:hypothetical protein
MNWLDKLKDYAPSIASAVLSGGATLPQLAYKAIADATGLDISSMEQAQAAIESASPAELLALNQAEYTFQKEMEQLLVESQQIVNKTMQVEANSDLWWVSGWRPFIGFITGAAFFVCVCFVCWLTYQAIESESQDAMQMIPQIIFNFTTLFSIPGAILGIASHHRGKEKRDRAKV